MFLVVIIFSGTFAHSFNQNVQYKCHQLFVRRQVFRCYILQHLVQLVQLGLDYCQINLVFTFKVCVKRPPSLFGCLCNIVHCRIIHPHAGGEDQEKLRYP